MSSIKIVKGLGIYFICFGIILFFVSIGQSETSPDAVGGAFMCLLLITGPGIGLIMLANKMKNELPGLIRKCPYCAEVINKDAVVCRHCKRDLK
jgi:hypothetical protein